MKSFSEPFIDFLSFGRIPGDLGVVQSVIGERQALMVMHRFAGKQLTIPCVNDGKMHANAKTKLLSEIIGEEKARQLIMQLGPRTLTIPNFRIFVNLRLMEGELPEVGVNMERSIAMLQNE